MTNRHPQRQLRRGIGIAGALMAPLSLAWLAYGALSQDGPLALVALIGLAFGIYMLVEYRTSEHRPAPSLALRAAVAMNVTIIAAATAEPLIGASMAVAALIPAVLVLAYAERRVVRRLMVAGVLSGMYAALVPTVLPWASDLGMPWAVLLPTSALVIAYVVFHVFLWNASGQLTAATNELSAAMSLSREVAQTLDPQAVGRIIARHIATAAGASDCALSTWDRADNRLLTYAYHPPERQAVLDAAYDLADFPATRAVLMTGTPFRADVGDPNADLREVGYLRQIGQRSLVILPLVVRGESIGTVELTSDRSGAFSERDIALAELLAGEAAISLENARLYDQIRHQAFRDALTGLANRVLFHDRVSHALNRVRGRRPQRTAVLFLDVDHFKLLNDRFGHSRGDEVLQAVAERVRAAIRPGDTAARLGGDEFAVLLEEVDGPAAAILVAERLLAGLAVPIELDGSLPQVGATIGVALSSAGEESADDLLRNADIAMYAAKAGGRGRVELFHTELLEQAAARSELGARLRGAADR
ncbi:MAG: sensor domain-containing diguanylate cyclase, partial [Chloroflexi bacterium]|nr:sensor domain-containing diguanylate cyclase [Chloroflexota bacterium]